MKNLVVINAEANPLLGKSLLTYLSEKLYPILMIIGPGERSLYAESSHPEVSLIEVDF